MRNYREELLHNPVIKKLVDTSNPFNQAKLLIAVADLRVSLKRIEVESLIGV